MISAELLRPAPISLFVSLLRARKIASRGALVLGGAVVVFLLYRLFAVYTWRGGDCAPTTPRVLPPSLEVQPIRVMSFNTEGHAAFVEADHEIEIANVIRNARPDIVGLQEIHRRTWQTRRRDQLAKLASETGLKPAFGSAVTFLGGSFGNAVLTRGDIIATRVHDLPSIGEPRALLQATVRIDGAIIDVFVAHLTALGPFHESTRARQLRCVLSIVSASPHPWILMGDFNASPAAEEMKILLANPGVRVSGDMSKGTHKVTSQRLDYIFTDTGWTTISASLLEVDPSDHRPLLSELRRGGI